MVCRSSVRRAVVFGVAAASLGGGLDWAALAFTGGFDYPVAVAIGAALFWGVVGMLVGAFGRKPGRKGADLKPHVEPYHVRPLAYRALVGSVVGMIGCNAFASVMLCAALIFHGDPLGGQGDAGFVMTCIYSANVGGLLAAVIGAVLGPMGFHGASTVSVRPGPGRRQSAGAFLGPVSASRLAAYPRCFPPTVRLRPRRCWHYLEELAPA